MNLLPLIGKMCISSPTMNGSTNAFQNMESEKQFTPDYVINSLRRHRICSSDMSMNNPPSCHICLKEFYIGEYIKGFPVCKHYFHYYCIENWLKFVGAFCPEDRKNVFTHEESKSDEKSIDKDIRCCEHHNEQLYLKNKLEETLKNELNENLMKFLPTGYKSNSYSSYLKARILGELTKFPINDHPTKPTAITIDNADEKKDTLKSTDISKTLLCSKSLKNYPLSNKKEKQEPIEKNETNLNSIAKDVNGQRSSKPLIKHLMAFNSSKIQNLKTLLTSNQTVPVKNENNVNESFSELLQCRKQVLTGINSTVKSKKAF